MAIDSGPESVGIKATRPWKSGLKFGSFIQWKPLDNHMYPERTALCRSISSFLTIDEYKDVLRSRLHSPTGFRQLP